MDYTKILKIWNPWWISNKVDKNKSKIKRYKTNEIIKYIDIREILLIKGIRRAGKSTILYQVIDYLINNKVNPKNIFYFNFDQPLNKNVLNVIDELLDNYIELNNPKGRIYVLFDEIQNIVGWERWIKKEYDLKEKEIKFIITGSNNTLLSNKSSSFLTGRTISININPLSFPEYLKFINYSYKDIDLEENKIKYYFNKYLKIGGFPEIVLEKDKDINKKRLLDYFENILIRDIINLKNIKDTKKLKELAYYLITNICSQVSYSKLAQILALNKSTVKEYISYIQQSFLLFELNFYSYSLKKSIAIQRPKKIYTIDNGLREAVAFKFWDDNSKLVENIVFLELYRNQKNINYWYDKNEIDFVVQEGNKVDLINVCYSDDIPKRELKGFIEFEKNHSNVRFKIIITKNITKKEKDIEYIPIWKWLLK